MVSGPVRIIVIGGGGCTNGSDPEMDAWILRQIPVTGRKPRLGYLGTASGNCPDKHAGFRAAYGNHATLLEAPPPMAPAAECAAWLGQLDLVYVGGGNTRTVLESWRQTGWDAALANAARSGIMFAGVSAGGISWFDAAFSDADRNGLTPLAGLGLISGSCCPHYSEEPWRQPAYQAAIGDGVIAPGIAIDDGVAVLCDNRGAIGWMSARPGVAAYRIERLGTSAVSRPLPRLPASATAP